MLGRMMVSALALTGVAYAQEAQTPPANETAATPAPNNSDRVTYDAAYFNQYTPQTALDMVNQTPGFSLNGGDDRRGFSGAVGNLLIDGLRPSSKSQSLDGILSRIPASQVLRIELLRGAAVAGDASGQAVLLNIVRTPTAGSGVYSAGIELTSRGVPAPRGEISYSGRNGNFEWGLGASIFSQYRDLPGWRLLYEQPGDIYFGRAETPSPRDFREATLNGNVAFPLVGGRMTATAQTSWFRFHADNDYFFFDAADNPDSAFLQDFEEGRQTPNYEVGVNYDRDIGPWTLGLIGLLNRSFYRSDEYDQFLDGAGALTDTFTQNIEQEAGETIGRFSLSRSIFGEQRIEFGGEVAFNSLDQVLVLGGSAAPPSVDNANLLIEEERAEFFAVHTWRPNDVWSVETRLAWETSTLTFTGDTDQEVDLAFWKPSVQVTRTFAGNNQLRFRVYRDVGQLDFGDFVSAVGTADSLVNGGNPDLFPQTDWRAELGADLRFGEAALSLTLTRHQYSDVADLVTLTDDHGTLSTLDDTFYDAAGNLGDGEATSLEVNFSTPVPFVPNSRLTINGNVWDTQVHDPLTGQDRIFSQTPESEVEIDFRQDFRDLKLAWGLHSYRQGEVQAYRFNEIDTSEEGPWIDLWVETTALPNNMRLRFWALNAFDGTVDRTRRFFTGNRNGAPDRWEQRARQFSAAPWVLVELSGNF